MVILMGTCHQFVLYFMKGLFGTWIQALSNKNTVVGDIDFCLSTVNNMIIHFYHASITR